eukprot:UN33726
MQMKNTLLNKYENEIESKEGKKEHLIENIKDDLHCLQDENHKLVDTKVHQEKVIKDLRYSVIDLERKRCLEEDLRRKLHNQIQELKGNIRVMCRIRPYHGNSENRSYAYNLLKDDITESELNVQTSNKKNLRGELILGEKIHFKFDKIFMPFHSQKDVFTEIAHLVQSCLDGFKVCIFAYGQTGSGKTYTMEGPCDSQMHVENESDVGVLPRAVKHIFNYQKQLKEKKWEFQFACSCLEIYNDNVYDLLCVQSKPRKHLNIVQTVQNDKQGFVEVPGFDTNFRVLRRKSDAIIAASQNK